MVVGLKNSNFNLKNIDSKTFVGNNQVVCSLKENAVKNESVADFFDFNSNTSSIDRFVDENNEYVQNSLEIIMNNEYTRDKYGNKINRAFKDPEELILALENLKNMYSKYEKFSYYNQNLYPEKYKYDSIKESGCCPTCFAMVASYLVGEEVIPIDVIDAFSNYCYKSGTDVSGNCFPDVSSKYGLNAERVDWRDRDAIIKELQEGHPIILNVGKGYFTRTGHYIVLLGIDNKGNVLIADPNSVSNSCRNYTVDELLNQTNRTESAAWSFKKSS